VNQAQPIPKAAAELLSRFFLHRTDQLAVLAPWEKPTPATFTAPVQQLLEGHLRGPRGPASTVTYKTKRAEGTMAGRWRLGAYSPAPDGTVKWVCIDFDGANHKNPLEDAQATALATQRRALAQGLPAYLERSGSGLGWHLWVFFSAPVPVGKAHDLGHRLAPRNAFLAGGGLADPSKAEGIEVFPKQNGASRFRYGNMVWLPWWSGAAKGGNLFYRADESNTLVPYAPETFEAVAPDQVDELLAKLPELEEDAPAAGVAPTAAPVGPASPDWKDWREKALAALPLDTVYGEWLTGGTSGDGWLQCRDPASPSGDQTPSAGVATGAGEAQRGRFHSFRTGESISVFDFMVRFGGQPDHKAAVARVAELAGVPLPKRPMPSAAELDAWADGFGQPAQGKAPGPGPGTTGSPAAPSQGQAAPPAQGPIEDDEIFDHLRLTDLGNAERLVRQHGENLRYCHALESWFMWDGAHWGRDGNQEVARRAQITARTIRDEVAHVRPVNKHMKGDQDRYDAEVKAIKVWSKKSEGAERLGAMAKLGSTQTTVQAEAGQFDLDPWALNLLNGTMDLRTGQIRAHRRADLLSKMVLVEYDPDARAPRWERFIEEIFLGDVELMEFVQRAVGYSLTGSGREQCFFLCKGEGENGKGKLLNTLFRLLGPLGVRGASRTMEDGYSLAMEAKSFCASKYDVGGDKPRPDLVKLRGARLVVTSEPPEGARFDEALLKKLTGEDPVTFRTLNKEPVGFMPSQKLWVLVNGPPESLDLSKGFWRRVRVIPFDYEITNDNRDRQLDEKFQAEASGILNWALAGCAAWLKHGLGTAERVEAATAVYKADMDPVARFLEERCERGPDLKVGKGPLFDAYKAWCWHGSEQVGMSKNEFGARLATMGFEDGKSGPWRYWTGLAIKDASPESQDSGDASQTKKH